MSIKHVKTKYGLVCGVAGENSHLTIFKGIPYAKPPIGNLRLMAPQEPEIWEGERNCNEWPSPCIQDWQGNIIENTSEKTERKGFQVAVPEGNEDCLYLNIFTPAESEDEKLPVMLWIHGGGFGSGWSGEPDFRGEKIVEKGIILVTINYRCGVLGFFAHKELAEKDINKSAGNYGIQDQIAALKWIYENIAFFGGNPENITVFGQSAGGMSTKFLLCAPQSKDIIKHAIIQSGGGINSGDPTRPWNEISEVTNKVLIKLGWTIKDVLTRDALEVNREINKVTKEILEGKELFFYQPCIDGFFIPELPEKMIMEGNISAADIIDGSVDGDSWMFSRKVRKSISESDTSLLRAFSYLPGYALGRYRIQSNQKPIRTYFIERNIPGIGNTPHSFDIPYIFGTMKARDVDWEKYDFYISEILNQYWVNFAKTGDPNGYNLPEWPLFCNESPYGIHIKNNEIIAENLIDSKNADAIIKYTLDHPGMLESLEGFELFKEK